MVATLERPRTETRPTLTIDALGNIAQARVSASAAGLANTVTIARGNTGLTPQYTAEPIREFETG